MLPPPHTATQLLPVRAFTCSVLVSTLLAVEVVDDGFVADDNDDVDEDNDEDEESERPFVVLSLLVLVVTLLLLPTFIIRVFTAACATDLKSASVGGFDKTAAAGAAAFIAADDVVVWGAVATGAFGFSYDDNNFTIAGAEVDTDTDDSIGSCFIATVLAKGGGVTQVGVICLTNSVFTGTRAVVVATVKAAVILPLFDNVSGFGVLFAFFFLMHFLCDVPPLNVLLFFCLGPVARLTRRFGEGAVVIVVVIVFLFVPQGDVTATVGAAVA